uniref:Light-harvesting complex protein Lhcc4 n=1 Tax=Rhodomonas sp. (strain CS 24) TaxID=79257 RepID=Q53IY6_RHDS2|nr:Light-harvesting complex protein Lhcc4 [Rhodomonas sp. CS24]
MLRAVLALALAGSAAAFMPTTGMLPKTVSTRATATRGPVMQDRFSYKTTCGYDIQAPYWAENGGIFGWPDVIWAREAEVKHGRIAMLAATGLIVQDLFTLPFYGKWYTGEKVWALHDKLVSVGAAWQVLLAIGALEFPFINKCIEGTLDGTGDYGFDPLSLKSDRRAVTEIKNGRLAMIAFGGMMQHYLLTGKGPVQFITQIPNFKSCTANAAALPGAKVASLPFFGNTLEVASALCR